MLEDFLKRMRKEGMLRKDLQVELKVLARSLFVLTRFWMDHLREIEGLEQVSWEDQERGIQLPKNLPIRDVDRGVRLKKIGKAVKPQGTEVDGNVRSRSAVMRIAERVA